jgi:hypothetical protein
MGAASTTTKAPQINTFNPSLHPIAARWAAPGELFVEPVEKVDFGHQNTCNGTGNLI